MANGWQTDGKRMANGWQTGGERMEQGQICHSAIRLTSFCNPFPILLGSYPPVIRSGFSTLLVSGLT